jgi:uncharacterized membrane protein
MTHGDVDPLANYKGADRMTNENTEIVIAVFEGENRANEVLVDIDESTTSELETLRDHVTVISLDEQGKLSASAPKKQKRQSTVGGALVGVLVGAALGLPVVGAVLGGVVGAHRAAKKKKTGQDFSLDQVTELMMPDSSMVVAEVEDWRVGMVMSNLEMRGAKQVLHATQAELAQAIAAAEESSGGDAGI